MDYTRLPKVELHLHLDCSLSYQVVQKLDPHITYEAYKSSFVGPVKCYNLADFITRAQHAIALMQTTEQLRLVTLDLFDQLQADGVIYAEIRFAPLEHTRLGLSPQEVVQAVNDAVQQGIAQTGVEVRVILCTLRHYSEAQSMETVQLVKDFQGTYVVAFDIASDEAGFPITQHIRAFEFANAHQLHCTAHAGEAKGAESVWETLQYFHPSRIGHGVRSLEDAGLMEFLKKNQVHLEVCPTSNVQTNIYPRIQDHRIDEIYHSGVSMSVNTDARAIANVTLSSEYQTLEEIFKWDLEHFLTCNLEAIEHAFVPDELKETLRNKLLMAY
ncbi:adenosine deaminase [Haliscomenobacter hydrossis]|uniref:adenosine deaminase n=1 Tax=Haliscomenobacter hydrossis (strain ATCC 27775 / DSM 1100 / LMG 10767 / O) TaxID=760192 RepID=F4KWZ3_HALH1|nr:adenosine deaminase [Haliscomenobacter hydrossis]AEE53593.1 Adenosine deaminase [Haliscomenobacter hydrossis DSM 1100]